MNVNNCPIIGLNREVQENFGAARAIRNLGNQGAETFQANYQSCKNKEVALKDLAFSQPSLASAEFPPMFCPGPWSEVDRSPVIHNGSQSDNYGVTLGGREAKNPFCPPTRPVIHNGSQWDNYGVTLGGREAKKPFCPPTRPVIHNGSQWDNYGVTLGGRESKKTFCPPTRPVIHNGSQWDNYGDVGWS